jgi:hypothetical protein
MSSPAKTMRPARAGSMPQSALMSVVLPAPVRPDDREQLAGAERQRDAPERRRRAVPDPELVDLKQGRA